MEENARFLCIKMKPYSTCCGFSLKMAAIVIGVLDVVDGIFNFIRFTYQATAMYQGEASTMELCKALTYFIVAFSIVFAGNGLKSLFLHKKNPLSDYSLFKQFEFVSLTAIAITYEFAELQFLSGFSIPSLVYLLVSRILLYYISKVVWSASVSTKKDDNFVRSDNL